LFAVGVDVITEMEVPEEEGDTNLEGSSCTSFARLLIFDDETSLDISIPDVSVDDEEVEGPGVSSVKGVSFQVPPETVFFAGREGPLM
jgi:hypothetical protein